MVQVSHTVQEQILKGDDCFPMTAKQLKKLSRVELIELLLEQQKKAGAERLEGDTVQEAPEVNQEQLEAERTRLQYRKRYYRILRSTLSTLITVAAVAVLVATLWMPVLKIYGASMSPTLTDGEIILSRKTSKFVPGDIVAFYYNNKILVKRVIGRAGDWIDIDEEGTVYVNQIELKEPYLTEKALGECDIELPYQVPDGRIFVMGDHRSVSVDSRSSAIGCISQEQIVGRITFRIWPLKRLGVLK